MTRIPDLRVDIGIGGRQYQEDRIISFDDARGNFVCGVADGHGGRHTAHFLQTFYADELLSRIGETDHAGVAKSIHDTHKKIEQDIVADGHGIRDGSTLCVCLFVAATNTIYMINVGDSRGVVCDEDAIVFTTKDHTPSSEEQHIIANGGCVVNMFGTDRVNGSIAVGRSFGDLQFGPSPESGYNSIISCEPTITPIPVYGRMKVYIATDGVWDHREPSHVGRVIWDEDCITQIHDSFSPTDNFTSVCFTVGT